MTLKNNNNKLNPYNSFNINLQKDLKFFISKVELTNSQYPASLIVKV